MAEIIKTKGQADIIGKEILKIIRSAQKEVFIISPYISTYQSYKESLVEAVNHKVDVTIVYGKKYTINDKRDDDTFFRDLDEFKRFELKYLDQLHAKVYCNESEAIVTSMNLYDSSIKNYEIAVKINKRSSEKEYSDLREEVDRIVSMATPRRLLSQPSNSPSNKTRIVGRGLGFCIRCGREIPFNIQKPYCPECYDRWSDYMNPDYQENYCHRCRANFNTSMNRPLDYDCWSILENNIK